jgi:hypothetical protein
MTLQEWINQEKVSSPELNDFLGKIAPYFLESGFNATELERKIRLGIIKAETDIEDSLKLDHNVNG